MEWMDFARALIGTRETPGPGNNSKIMGWASRMGARILGIVYPNDATPWCGLFVAHCLFSAGIKPAAVAIRAKAWATWGRDVEPCEGAVLVFSREGGGHVGFYAGEDATCYHVLGGNQSDMVCISRIQKSRCVASRWPDGEPLTGRRIFKDAAGNVSSNER